MKRKKLSADELLQEFNTRSNLSELISRYVSLTPRGNSFIGKCPFHNEKTPSFNVNDEKGLFYCFGCKVGGNAFTFLQKYKNFSFLESVKYLSTFLGIDFTPSNPEVREKNDKIFEILNKANEFFKTNLRNNRYALDYLKKRKINLETQELFQVGFCPSEDVLISFFKKINFFEEDLKKADLLIPSKKGDFFGRFKDRITFPIFNFSNKIVGFGGRTIYNSKIKYINSQESNLFKKKEILYGLTQNFNDIKKNKEIILVEGYMDVISMYQNNIKYALSPMGTTLSPIQILKLWNYTDVPFICFDGDEAGQEATKKIAFKILEFLKPGKSFKIIRLPYSDDPDSFFNKKKNIEFDILKNESQSLADFLWKALISSFDNFTPEFLAKIDETIKLYSDKIKDRSVSIEYFRFFKEKKSQFLWEMNLIKRKVVKQKNLQNVQENINEKLLIVYAVQETEIFSSMIEEISKTTLINKNLEEIKKNIIDSITDSEKDNDLTSLIKNKYSSILEKIKNLYDTHLKPLQEEEKHDFLRQILNNLKLPELLAEKEKLKKKIIASENQTLQDKLVKEHSNLVEEINNIKKKNIE